jgi:hypothetical protein
MNLYICNFRKLRLEGIFAGLLILSALASCREKAFVNDSAGKTPLVEIEGNVLYSEDLQKVLPLDCTDEDSAEFAERYIKNWIAEMLFYKNAVRNIPDTKEIDQLVENYRRSLILHEYQQRLIEQKIDKEVSDQDIKDFYNNNLRLFVLNEPMIKGLFLKIPLSAPNIGKIKTWYKQSGNDAFDEIEKYSIKYAVRYEFFYDRWLSVSDIEMLLPPLDIPLEDMLNKQYSLEFNDEQYIYLLNVSEYITKGSYEPVESATGKIRDLLMNNKEVSYMQQIKDELYKSALDKDIIIFHNKKK